MEFEVIGTIREMEIMPLALGRLTMRRKNPSAQFVVCVKNKNYPASLEVRKIYRSLRDPSATAHRLIRVIDESGEDYLYPEDYFVSLELPGAVKRVLVRT